MGGAPSVARCCRGPLNLFYCCTSPTSVFTFLLPALCSRLQSPLFFFGNHRRRVALRPPCVCITTAWGLAAVPFGSDFQYTNASINYDNMDKLMAYMNTPENQQHYRMRLQYSTPTTYMKTLHAYNHEWPLKTDDFESYAIGPDQFLVGFYSSRPDLKGFVRAASAQLQAANAALTNLVLLRNGTGVDAATETAALDIQASALGVAQHHDAITSSQRRHVHRDYIAQLSLGQIAVDGSACRTVAATVAGAGAAPPTLVTCPYINESSCPASQAAGAGIIAVVLQNPTGQAMVGFPVKIPVGSPCTVSTGAGAVVSQFVPAWPASPFVHGGSDQPPMTLHAPAATATFLADVPALGTATYFIEADSAAAVLQERELQVGSGDPVTLDNGIVKAEFDASGLLQAITKAGVTVQVKQTLRYYIGGQPKDSKHGGSGSGNCTNIFGCLF